jgi:hypothetical protein
MNVDDILNILKYGGIVVAGGSGLLGTLTKTHDKNRKLTAWGIVSVVITILSLLVALGAQYAEGVRQKRQDSESRNEANELKEKNTEILKELQGQKAANDRSEQEFREKFQAVLVQLDAAKHEDSKRITEEKIRVIQKDFTEWATNFVKNFPTIKDEIDKTKRDFEQGKLQSQIDETKKEVQTSEQAFPVISFAIRYVQEAVRAYSKQTSKEIKIDLVELPKNFYEKQTEYEIRFNTNAVWKFHIGGRRPVGQYNHPNWFPYLQIEFKDSQGKESGRLSLQTNPAGKKFSMNYEASIPTPDPATVAGDRELSDYETPVREVFQRVIEAQLVQAVE